MRKGLGHPGGLNEANRDAGIVNFHPDGLVNGSHLWVFRNQGSETLFGTNKRPCEYYRDQICSPGLSNHVGETPFSL